MRQAIREGTEMASETSDPSPRSYPRSVSLVRRAGPIIVAAGIADSFTQIENWLLEEASVERQMIDLLVKLIRRMKAANSSVDRLTLHIGTLHPQLVGFAWVWNADDGFCDKVRVADAAVNSDAYRLNPLQRIVETGDTIRRRPNEQTAQAEFPIMIELAAAGMTDYVAIPLSGLDTRNVVTIATKAARGFAEVEIESLTRLFKLFALHVQRHSELKISENALGAYLGYGAATRVLEGAIKRGAGDSIRAVIWVSDLRNFTKMSDALAPADTLLLLNAYFETMVSAVAVHGGEILKFIGDGMLNAIPQLYGEGWVVVGDAAQLNNAIHREGSNLAMTSGRIAAEAIFQVKSRRDPMTAENLSLYKKMLDKSFVIKDLKKYKDMPALMHTQSQNFFLTYPDLVSKAMQNFLRVDGTPKIEKEKLTLKSFIKARSWTGLFGDAFRLARAWR